MKRILLHDAGASYAPATGFAALPVISATVRVIFGQRKSSDRDIQICDSSVNRGRMKPFTATIS
jgi:hypothetical protein